jgi:hypothetical protein
LLPLLLLLKCIANVIYKQLSLLTRNFANKTYKLLLLLNLLIYIDFKITGKALKQNGIKETGGKWTVLVALEYRGNEHRLNRVKMINVKKKHAKKKKEWLET